MTAAALERFAAEALAALAAGEWEEADGGESPLVLPRCIQPETTRARYPDTTSSKGACDHGG